MATTPGSGAPPRRPFRQTALAMLAVFAMVLVVAGVVAALTAGPTTAPPASPSAAPTSSATNASTRPTPTTEMTLIPLSPAPAASRAPVPQLTLIPLAPAPPTASPGPTTALTAARALPVKGRAPRTGYERDLFGSGWVDVDRNGCDTRNDILARDLTATTVKPGTNGCVVLIGLLQDPYSGEPISFLRGNTTSNDVQIDHVVALGDAWQKGAQTWDPGTRIAFANDPLNLLAVSGPLNQQKGDGDTATWLPPNKGFRCEYVTRQIAVKLAYRLWATQTEQDAMVRVLETCPDEPLPR